MLGRIPSCSDGGRRSLLASGLLGWLSVSAERAQGPVGRELERIRPEAVRLALEDQAARWPCRPPPEGAAALNGLAARREELLLRFNLKKTVDP